jgi:glycerol-3-phosphate acyltransferase PlsX
MKIAVDAMGGDYAPEAIVEGAIQAADEYGVSIVLVGQEDRIMEELAKHDTALLDIKVQHASQVVDMHDEPSFALRRKRESSLHGAIHLVRDGYADAAVSAGNTGAGMAIGKVACRPLEGIDRPALGTAMPNVSGETVLIDVGANVDCKPVHLLQFAVMGHVYAKELLKINNPRIGLLSTGEEPTKGNTLTKEVFEPLNNSPLNFIGNVEGRDVFNGRVDVIVCDGFAGNVVLKASEGVAKTMGALLKEGFTQNWRTKLGYLLVKPAIEHLKKRTDYTEYGGAPLLGLNGVVIISHGSSKARAIKNAIRVARESAELQLPEKIALLLEECEFDIKSRKKATSFWRHLRRSIRHDEKDRKPSEKEEDVREPEGPDVEEANGSTPSQDIPPEPEPERRGWWHLRESKSQAPDNPSSESQVELSDDDEAVEPMEPGEDELHTNEPDLQAISTDLKLPDGQRKGLWWHLTHRDHPVHEPQAEEPHTTPEPHSEPFSEPETQSHSSASQNTPEQPEEH